MSSEPNLLSEVRFGAFLQYSPRGTGEVSVKSRQWCAAVKNDEPGRIRQVITALRTSATELVAELFGPDVALVPAPRSAPLRAGALWPARRICEELVAEGLAGQIYECVERVTAVQKSAFAQQGERPTPQVHLNSMRTRPGLLGARRILVVDDVVTMGATLLASASLVRDIHPEQAIATFGLVRTMGLVPEVGAIVQPCTGTIRLMPIGRAWRDP